MIEAVLLLGFAIPLWARRVNQFPPGKEALLVHVVAQQFSFNYHLPGADGQFARRDVNLVSNSNPLGIDPKDPAGKDDIVTTGELHVPVGRPVIAELSSKDVIHDYFIPDMRIAGDAIPGSLIPIWFTPVKTGTYEVICAQLCGLGHYGMKGTLVVDTPQDYLAWLTCIATLLLICSGGMVTSKGVGLAVPDWPTTFGYNMFLFPVSKWVGGILFEHTHRLMGSIVGFLTIILAMWLWLSENRQWVRNLGVIALAGVILQGILGGLRVTMMKDEIGVFP